MSLQSDLLSDIESFLAKQGSGMSETTFGRLAVNDGKLIGRLRKKCNMTVATLERVRAFMEGTPEPLPSRFAGKPHSKSVADPPTGRRRDKAA